MNSIKERFANLLEKPDRVELRNFIQNNFGELDSIDFKGNWCSYSKLAKHILAIANSGGGFIFVGIHEIKGEIKPIGIDSFIDKADIYKGVEKFIPSELEYEILDFHYKESEYADIKGKKFQAVWIRPEEKHIPFVSKKQGEGIRLNTIYTRRGTQSVEVNQVELQNILNRRIESEYSTSAEIKLEEHLEELKILYAQVKPYFQKSLLEPIMSDEDLNSIIEIFQEKNEKYPTENYEDFIIRMIDFKKSIIEKTLKK